MDACGDVESLVRKSLADNRFVALVSFTFNFGQGNPAKSTLRKRLNARDYGVAAVEVQEWNKVDGKVLEGLVAGRAAEAALFQTH